MERLSGLLGVFALMAIAYSVSNNRKAINWKTVIIGISLQLAFALLILKTVIGKWVFQGVRHLVAKLLMFSDYGAHFIFGNLYLTSPAISRNISDAIPSGGLTEGFVVYNPTTGGLVELGTVFAFHVLPTIIFFGSLMALLYHLGIMQRIVKGFAWLMSRMMGTSGAESFAVASNIFVGQTEAPFVVRPFLKSMTNSELMALMTGGFATVAGGVMAAYVRFGIDAGHLMAASVMSAPAALVMAKIIIPETEDSVTGKSIDIKVERQYSNIIDAAAGGATDGMKLAVNVAAMLIAFIALIAMINATLCWAGGFFGWRLSLDLILGYIFSPLAFLIGVSPQDILEVGNLLGVKISINEFVGYIKLGTLRDIISDRSFTIATYALCGFANFASIAIQIGGIAALVPERRKDLAKLGLRAMVAGALASWQTAAIAGIIL